jgi:hypothetical protein
MFRILLLAALAFGASSTAAAQDATVYIGHGINGTDLVLDENLPVDVKVNGSVLLSGFEFRSFTEGLDLAAGPYNIQIGVADPINPGSQPALIDVNVDLFAGENVTILAHLDEFGGLTASKFINETDPVDGLNGRLSAAHAAAAPAVDVRLKELQSRRAGQLSGVTNGLQGAGVFRPLVFGLDLVAAGTTTQVLGPVYLPVLPGSRTAIYVVGSLANDTLEPLVLNY